MSSYNIILGSSSPRRVELLRQIGLPFLTVKPLTEEIMRTGEKPEDYVIRNSLEKAQWVLQHTLAAAKSQDQRHPLVISADTVVVLDHVTLEKPVDHKEALRMLRQLSGRTHTVMTGVTLMSPLEHNMQKNAHLEMATNTVSFRVDTEVTLKSMCDEELQWYISTGEPLDKSGAYAAQGVGGFMVERIQGSYANVVGLPVCDVVKNLKQYFNLKLWDFSQVTAQP